jgi:capsid protein
MSQVDWLRFLAGGSSPVTLVEDAQTDMLKLEEEAEGPVQVRRWDAAWTHRLNSAQFEEVTGNSVNEDLVDHLPTLIDRCMAEISTNSNVDGIVATYTTDLLGPEGPFWHVLPRDVMVLSGDEQMKAKFKAYAKAANEALGEWMRKPDLQEELSGHDILKQDIYGQFGAGNSLVQIVRDESVGDRKVQTRWLQIDVRRVFSHTAGSVNYGKTGKDEFLTLGIVRDRYGKKKRYLVQQPDLMGTYKSSMKFEEVPVRSMIHRYVAKEAGQILGVPWLASVLPVLGDLRQFDKFTMETAKLSASLGIIISDKFDPTKNPSNGFKSSVVRPTFRSGSAQVMSLPANKEATIIDPKIPGAQYIPYRAERWRDVGRAFQMPLLLVRLGAEEHSYSSARFDAQVYKRAICGGQRSIVAKYGPSLDDVLMEHELLGLIPRRPVPIEVSAVFQPMPHVDPEKEQKATETSLNTLSTTLLDVWQQEGKRPEDMIYRLQESREALNEVMPGLGDAMLVAKLGKTDPRVMAQFGIVDKSLLETTSKAVPTI